MAKLSELESVSSNFQPTLVILETVVELEEENDRLQQLGRTFSQLEPKTRYKRRVAKSAELHDSYGFALLEQICAEISNRKFSKLVVPIAMIPSLEYDPLIRPRHQSSQIIHKNSGSISSIQKQLKETEAAIDPRKTLQCLDAGAIDVLSSPLRLDRVSHLTVHAYRAYKEACKDRAKSLAINRLRKRSWVGFEEKKPYAYLREDMYVYPHADAPSLIPGILLLLLSWHAKGSHQGFRAYDRNLQPRSYSSCFQFEVIAMGSSIYRSHMLTTYTGRYPYYRKPKS